MGRLSRFKGNYKQAIILQTENLFIARQTGNKWQSVWALISLGELAYLQGDYALACVSYHEAVSVARELNDREAIAFLIEGVAALNAAQGEVKRAATLFGAAANLRITIHKNPLPVERIEIDRNIALAREKLEKVIFDAAWAEGQALTFEQAVAFVMEQLNPSDGQQKS